jgi:hypothetical protein
MGIVYKGKCTLNKGIINMPQMVSDNLKLCYTLSSYSGTNSIRNLIKNEYLTLNNSPVINSSFNFNGVDQSITGSHSGIDLTNSTIDLWMKIESQGSSTRKVPFYISDTSSKFIFIDVSPNVDYLQVNTESKNINIRSSSFLQYPSKFFNLTIVRTSSEIQVLLNSFLVNSILNEGYTGAWNPGVNLISLGASIFANTTQDFFSGSLYQVRVYDRALNELEIAENYTSWKGKFY